MILIDYNRDGWPDIFFTNAPTVVEAIKDQKNLEGVRGALYRKNRGGTFTDVTQQAGLTTPYFGMGAVGDYNNDGEVSDDWAKCVYRLRRHVELAIFRQVLRVRDARRAAISASRFESSILLPSRASWDAHRAPRFPATSAASSIWIFGDAALSLENFSASDAKLAGDTVL